jgi:FlaA1/EpsC-like NDP-sugar epimerase
MGAQFKSLNFYLLLLLDLGLVVLAHLLAYLTRFEGVVPGPQWENFIHLLPYFSAIKLGSFFYFDLYRGMWRYTSLPDMFNIVKAVLVSSLLMVGILILGSRFFGFSRSVFLLDGVYTIIFIAALRVGIRLVYGLGWVRMPGFLASGRVAGAKKKCVLLGAGKAGEKLVREILGNPDRSMELTAIFDDDPAKTGRLLHGVPIVGAIRSLPYWVSNEGVDIQEILIAMPSLSGGGLRQVMEVCEMTGIPFKTIPSLSEIANGTVSIKALRDVDYRDLLGREQAHLEMKRISGYLEGKVVLVTGAGGSIGSELCRQIIPFNPAQLIMLDASEFNLYTIQMELEHERRFTNFIPVLGNLQDSIWTEKTLDQYRPEVIFHAAAYKHVPMLETQPWQAVRNNVLATASLVRAAVERGVERLLVVSTDKAVRPTNVMGATKRLTERIMQAHCGRGTRLMAVRFGNVVGSAGSVIPLFRSQIERGGPVTVTHPDVVRYFMTVDESCQLILQAGSMGEGGEIFVLKMGKPIKIAEMAVDLIRLSGKEPGRDIEIKFIGLRPGEKLYEELIIESEGVVPTEHSKILVLRGRTCDWEDLEPTIDQLEEAARAMQGEVIKDVLRRVVPEYVPSVKNSAAITAETVADTDADAPAAIEPDSSTN